MYKIVPDSPDFPTVGLFTEYIDAYIFACNYLPIGYEFYIEEI